MKSNAKPEIKAEIFRDCIRTVFLPHLAELRLLDDFAEEIALLLMENCSRHIASLVM
jgi:hypothetical protein